MTLIELRKFLSSWKYHRQQTLDLLNASSDADLSFTPGKGLGPLAKQFETEHIPNIRELNIELGTDFEPTESWLLVIQPRQGELREKEVFVYQISLDTAPSSEALISMAKSGSIERSDILYSTIISKSDRLYGTVLIFTAQTTTTVSQRR